jgi:hypothetical protein
VVRKGEFWCKWLCIDQGCACTREFSYANSIIEVDLDDSFRISNNYIEYTSYSEQMENLNWNILLSTGRR